MTGIIKWAIFSAVLYFAFTSANTDGKVINFNDPELVGIRPHILKAYQLRPPPINQCSPQEHRAAIRMYTRALPEHEQNDLIFDMQASIMNNSDDYYIGVTETLAALYSSKIKYMLYWDNLMLNSATYRNGLSGRTITLHSIYSAVYTISPNYTEPETGCVMDLVSCLPFVKWVSQYWTSHVPQITRLELGASIHAQRNLFVKMSDGIGGRFTEMVKFTDNTWLTELFKTNALRKSVLSRGFSEFTGNGTEVNLDYVGDAATSTENHSPAYDVL